MSGDKFTVEDIRAAVRLLEQHSVPPLKCEDCGEEVYAFAPPGGEVPAEWTCVCGHANSIVGGQRAAGCLVGRSRR